MPSDPAVQTPSNKNDKKWYLRFRTWLVAAVVTGLTAFVAAGVEKLLDVGTQKLAGPPIKVVAQRFKDCPFSYVLPGSPNQTPPPPSLDNISGTRDDWARRLGGADGGFTQVEVTVTGSSDRAVVLQGLQVEIIDRARPIQGFEAHAVCGDLVALRYITVDLDMEPPVITEAGDNRSEHPDMEGVPEDIVTFPYKVSESEPEVFSIFASTERCNCKWQMRLRWVSGNDSGEYIIDDEGKPFHTHGTEGLRSYVSNNGEPLTPVGTD